MLFSFIDTTHGQCNSPPCGAGNIEVEVQITTDNFPREVSWLITDVTSGLPGCGIGAFGDCTGGLNGPPWNLAANTTYTWTLCYPAGNDLVFVIADASSDGICCGFGNGSYEVSICGGLTTIATGGAFLCDETTAFTLPGDCCAGGDCTNGIQDGNETGVDCGGPCCAACPPPPPISASDCPEAVDVCTNLGFQIQPDGIGLISEIPALGTLGNPNNANPGGSGNFGCLRATTDAPPNPTPEKNSTWMIITIDNPGLLEFTLGGNGTQLPNYYDWIMYPWTPTSCTDIPANIVAPVRCNWNGVNFGGTGLATTIPAGGHFSNYEPPLAVNCGDKYIICFSNWSSAITNVPLEFYGTASVTCSPEVLTITVIPPNPTICLGESVTLTANGADTYTWSPATGLSATTGTSVIANPTVTTTYTVTGLTGCVSGDTTVTVIVQAPSAGYTYSGSQCLSSNNVSFTNTGDAPGSCGGGCPIYTWDFGDGTGSTGTNSGAASPSHVFSAAGTYTVTQIVDDGLCIASYSENIVISDPVSSVYGTEESCTDGCDGAVNLSILGGITPFTYVWSNGSGTEDIIDLCAGTYSVTVADAIGCVTTSSVTLNPIVDIVAGFTYNGNQCLLGNNYIFTNTGDAPFSCGANCPAFWWDYGDGTTSSGVDVAAANPSHTYSSTGSFTVTQVVTDESGCSDTTTLTILVQDPPIATAVGVDETCLGACDGTATVTTTGGAAIANYNWSTGASTQNITGLCAGNYDVTVTDINGCQDTSSVTIQTGTEIKAGFTYNGDQCLTGNSYVFTNTGSVPGVCGGGCPTYTWDFGDAATQSGTTAGDASPTHTYGTSGTFTVTQIVSNGGACADTMTQIITVYPEPTITIIPIDLSCGGVCDGGADLTVLTGTTPYTYNWSNFETAQDLNGVCAGTYDVTVTDSAGCQVTGTVVISEPTPILITLTPTDPSCNGACDGSISASVSGGTAPYTYLWDDPSGQTNANAIGLCANTFMLLVFDANGCSDSDTVSIVTPPLLGATTTGTPASCSGVCDGTATATGSGGTPPYTYAWGDPGFQTTQTAVGLCAGVVNVTVYDAGSCDTILSYTVTEPLPMTLSTTDTAATCGNPDGSACVIPVGGTMPYTYLWDDGSTQTDSCAINLVAGGYNIQVTDSNGCVATTPVAVSDIGAPTISVTDSTDVSCFGGADGTATVLGTGGTPTFTYSWSTSPVQTNTMATGLSAGTYTATLTDGSNCVTSVAVTIIAPPLLTASVTASTNASCATICDGTAGVSESGGTAPYTYSWDSSPVQSSAAATALCDGFYTITVTDSLGCTATDTITITEPVVLSTSIVGTDVSCNLGTDGTANSTSSGGTGPYTFAWSNSATTEDLTNLSAGTYILTVTDVNGCTDTASVTINEPLAISLSTVDVDANCGQADGSSTVSATGGTGAYTYSWNTSPAQTNAMATALIAGTYTATVTDSNGCSNTINATLLDIAGGTASAVVDNNTTGFGLCDAQATGSMTGGAAPYTYAWDDPGAQTSATATGLCALTYCVTVTDANGCTDSACVTITEPNAIVLSIVDTSNLCNGDCNGTADLTVTGGIAPYTYLWNPGGLTAEDIVNLCANTYTVNVTDSNGVVATASVTITEPAAPLAASVIGTDILCNGQTTGAINLSVTGGTSPYTYSWSPGGETTEDLSGLGAGSNTVTVTDTNGCTATASYTVLEPAVISLSSSGIDANCGQNDGQVSVSASGGVGPYTYAWNTSPVQTGNTATSVIAGTYTVIVTDSAGCQDSITENISDVGGGVATVVTDNDASCFGDCNGQVSISIVGGTVPFTYSWDDPSTQSNATAVGLCVGTYNVTATDGVGCVLTGSATIAEPGAIIAGTTGTDAGCFGICDGSATTSISGGTTPYTYAWSTAPIQTTSNATGLCMGNFTVTITDANGCDTTTTVSIGEPVAIVVNTSTVTSFCGQANGQASATGTAGTAPYSYAWSNGPTVQNNIGLVAGSYTVTVTDAGGCEGIGTAAVSDTTGPLASITSNIGVNCPGNGGGSLTVTVNDGAPPYTYSWDDLLTQTGTTASNLVEGIYVVTIVDSGGCTTTATDTITAPPVLVVSMASSVDPSCNAACDGSAVLTVSGGTVPYTYDWNDPGSQTTSTANGLCVGAVTGVVTDGNGCTDSASVTLSQPLPLNVTTTMTPVTCAGVCNGSISTTVSGGTTPYTYGWNDPSTQTTPTASALCVGGFMVTVTDAGGCTTIVSDSVTGPAALVSNLISLNGVSCNGLCDGSAEISVTGGNLPLTYLWSNGQTTPLIINLCGGTFTVDITDANGCTISDSVVIPEPAAMVNVFASTNVDCFGNSTGIATAGITGGSLPYTFLWDDVNLQTTASATGLVADTFTVQVTDSSGCAISESIVISEPVAIAMVLDTTGANCGLSDGSTCVTVSAGVAPFTYLWDDSLNQTTACAVGISSGSYNVTVTDSSGCTANALSVVNDLGAPALSISSFADAGCNGGCDGFATVQILNGDPPYVYSWNDSLNQTTANASGLCAGVYIVSILDSNNCSGSISVAIGEPTPLSVVISGQTSTTCNGDCDGTATALGAGGIPPYTYLWNDPGLQTTQTATGLCAGNYGLTLIDANGCTDTTSVTIAQPTIITLSTSIVHANCGLDDGSATVSASGGNGLYGYLWDDLSSQITATAINLDSGTYSVIVTDILGCTASATVTVNDIPPGVASIPISIDVACNGGNDGSATVSMAGGTLPFTYVWDDPLTQTNGTATGLVMGVITVSVTDSNGCVVTDSTMINEPAPITINVTGIDVSCKVGCDGSVTAVPSGGTGGYTYQWDDPLAQTTATATGLCAVQTLVTVSDINGCSDTASIVLGAPDSIVLSETHSDANCSQADGIGTITVTGGTAPYSYLWNPGGQTTPFVANLSAGTYMVTVTDSNACSETIPVTIADLNGPMVSISSSIDVSCYNGNNGQAVAVASGGNPPYTYSWNDPLSQITPTANSLYAGTYAITIEDTSGCIASTTVTINEPPLLVFNPASSDPSCFGDCNGSVGVSVTGGSPPYQYLWNDSLVQTTATATGLCANTYIVVIDDTNNCSEIVNITISDPMPITTSVSFTDESCFGACDGSVTVNPNNGTGTYTYSWDDSFTQVTQTAGGLCVGIYNVTVSDASGCLGYASSSVSGPADLTIAISDSTNNPCFGNCIGSAQTIVTGGSAPFTYAWSDSQGGAQAINLCAGIFDVTLTDGNGCTVQTSVTITQPAGMGLNVTGNNISCDSLCDGTGTASVSGGVPPYTYAWDDGSFQTTPIASSLCAGIVSVTVTDASGCLQSANIILTEPQPLSLNVTTISSTCGFANGNACINVIGGSAPYVTTWNDPNTTNASCISNVFAGTYIPNTVDANGCIVSIPVVIDDIIGPIIDSVSNTDVVCKWDSNGTATVFVAPGAAIPLTYIWRDNGGVTIDSNVTTTFGLWGSTYTVSVIDNNGCISGSLVAVFEPPALTSAIITNIPTSCNNTCDGVATIMTAGGTSPLSYLWTDGQTSSTGIGLCATTHSIVVTDNNGCTNASSVVIAEPDPIVIVDSINDASCFGFTDGSVYLNVTGGTPFYLYNWSPSGGSNNFATNLAPDTYSVLVTDVNGCMANTIVIVGEPDTLAATSTSAAATCGDPNGMASVTMSGGTQPYTYNWDDPLNTSTSTVNNLLPRNPYNASVTDAMGCMLNVPVVVVDEPSPIINSVVIDSVNCNGDADGEATVFYSGGTVPFIFVWDDPAAQSTNPATSLDIGPIQVTVIDGNGCSVSAVEIMGEPQPLVVTVSPPVVTICYGGNATITASASGGTQPYNSFLWTNGVVGSSQTAGPLYSDTSFTVLMSDDNNCGSLPVTVDITVNEELKLTVSDVIICEGEGAVLSASATGGEGTYAFVWSNGYVGSEQTIPGLMDADDQSYDVTVTDPCGSLVEVINVTIDPTPVALFTSEGAGCYPVVFADLTGSAVPIQSWYWDFGDGSFSTEADSTTHAYTDSGSYVVTLTVTSFDGCPGSYTDPIPIFVYGLPTAEFNMTQFGLEIIPPVISELSPWVDFVDSSYTNIASIFWNFGDPASDSNNTSDLFNPTHIFSDTGTYSVLEIVTNTNGCIDSIRHEITVEGEFILFAPNSFTPDGNGVNDYFMPLGIGVEEETFELYIFDRWGDLIAKVIGEFGNDTDPTIGWDGRANDGSEAAQLDVYVWLIRTEDVNGNAHEYVGHVTLLR